MSALPRGWVEATLGDVVFDIRNGKNVSQDKSGNGTAVSRIETIAKEVVDFDRTGFTTDLYREDDDLLKPGDVLFSHINSARHLGKTAVFPEHAKRLLHGINLLRITVATKATTPEFFHQQCRLFRQQGVFELNGQHAVNQSSINQKKLKELSFTLPPLPEQKRIVAKLDALNAKSARARTELARIETLVSRYKQAVLSKAFSGAKERLENYIISTFYGPRFSKENYVSDGIPTIRTTDFRADGSIEITDAPRVAVDTQDLKKWSLEAGDLLVTRTGSIGKCAVYKASHGPALPSAYLIRVRLDLDRIDPMFAYYVMISPEGFAHLGVKTTAVTQPNINAEAIRSMPIPDMPLEEQHEIVRRIESSFAKIDRLAKEAKRALELMGRLDEAILAKAFRGELVPQDENDEPAQHLLARIRAEREAAPKGKRGRGAKG